MRLIVHSLFVCLVSCCLVGLPGCKDAAKKTPATAAKKTNETSDQHQDDHEHAESYDEAVAELAEMEKVIRTAYEKDKPGDAHDALHKVGHLLEEVEEFIKKSDMDEATKKEANQAATDLYDAFTAVDDKVHDASEGKEFKEVSDTIEKAMAILVSHVDAEGTDEQPGDDDQPQDDDDTKEESKE